MEPWRTRSSRVSGLGGIRDLSDNIGINFEWARVRTLPNTDPMHVNGRSRSLSFATALPCHRVCPVLTCRTVPRPLRRGSC